jgi:tetratricopeptide (TPR) repeat protein
VALASYRKALALLGLERYRESIEVWDEIIDRFSADPPTARPLIALEAMNHKSGALRCVGRLTDAITLDESAAARCDQIEATGELRRVLLRSLETKRAALVAVAGNELRAAAVDDEIAARFGDAQDPELREHVALALSHQAAALLQAHRVDQALSISRDLVARFRTEPDATLLPVSEIMVTHIKTLANIGGPSRRGGAGLVLFALTNASTQLVKDAVATFQRHQPLSLTKVPAARSLVGSALARKTIPAAYQLRRQRLEQAIIVTDAVLDRSAAEDDADLQRLAATARIAAASCDVMLGRIRGGIQQMEAMSDSGRPDVAQACQHLASERQRGGRLADRIGAVSFLALRARTLGHDDPRIAQIAYDDSITANHPLSDGPTKLVARLLRPNGKTRSRGDEPA